MVQCWFFLYCAGQSHGNFAISRELSAVFLAHLSGQYARRSDEGWASQLPPVVHGGGFLSFVSWKSAVEVFLENCFQIFKWSQQQLAVFGAGLGEFRTVGGVLPPPHFRPPFWASALWPPHGAPQSRVSCPPVAVGSGQPLQVTTEALLPGRGCRLNESVAFRLWRPDVLTACS